MIERESTKQLLASSIMDLSRRKPLEKISVTDITRNCNLARETFYYYFTDKNELISWMFFERCKDISTDYDQNSVSWREALTRFVSILKEDDIFCDNILNDQGMDSFRDSLLDYMCSTLKQSLINRRMYSEIPREVEDQIRFYSCGVAYLLSEWVKDRCKDSVYQIVNTIISCMSDAMSMLFP